MVEGSSTAPLSSSSSSPISGDISSGFPSVVVVVVVVIVSHRCGFFASSTSTTAWGGNTTGAVKEKLADVVVVVNGGGTVPVEGPSIPSSFARMVAEKELRGVENALQASARSFLIPGEDEGGGERWGRERVPPRVPLSFFLLERRVGGGGASSSSPPASLRAEGSLSSSLSIVWVFPVCHIPPIPPSRVGPPSSGAKEKQGTTKCEASPPPIRGIVVVVVVVGPTDDSAPAR